MANGKKSVLLYCDIIHTIEKMDNETAGLFFKHYLRYVNDLNPITDNIIVDITFESVKQNLKRDLDKWELRAENSRKNGRKGGRKKKEEPKEPSGLKNNPSGKKEPVNVNVTDTVNVSVTDIKKSKNDIGGFLINKKIPSFDEFKIFALEKKRGVCLSALKMKYDSWIVNDWKNGNDKVIKNWKSTLLNTLPYIKEENPNKKETFSESIMGSEKHDAILRQLKEEEDKDEAKRIN